MKNQPEFKKLIANVVAPSIEYQKKIKRNKCRPEFARFKLVIHFLDGNSRSFYSYDVQPTYKNGVKTFITDEELGYLKLVIEVQKNIKGKYKDNEGVTKFTNCQNFRTAEIYCKLGTNLSTDIMDYNFKICKWVLNKPPEILEHIKFQDGKLILEPLIRIQALRENNTP